LPAGTDSIGRGVQSPNKSKPQTDLGGGATAAGRLPAIAETNQSRRHSSSSRATSHSAAGTGRYEMANEEPVEEPSTETGAEASPAERSPAERDCETGAGGSTSNASTMLDVGVSSGSGDPSQAPGLSKAYPLHFPLVQDRLAGQSTCASSRKGGSAKKAASTLVNDNAILGEPPMPTDNLDGSPTGEFQ
ncbi:hypothetical protein B484DRAFT_438330, partial [Ochromonadaceae sp. CCMP2298]